MKAPLQILFAPGSGAGKDHPWMEAWAQRLGAIGEVHLFDYPYREAGRSLPDKPEVLKDRHREAFVTMLMAAPEGAELLLVGKSMGSRVSAWLLAEGLGEWAQPWRIRGLVCFGFPLVGQGGKSREEELLRLYHPVLFLQGTRDEMGPLEALDEARAKMTVATAVHRVEGGDHSLVVGARALKAAGKSQQDIDDEITAAIVGWLEENP